MKILLVNTYYYPEIYGGAEYSVKKLAEELKQQGHTVKVLCTGSEAKREVIDGIDVIRVVSKNLCRGCEAAKYPLYKRVIRRKLIKYWKNISLMLSIQTDYMTFLQLSGKLRIKRRLRSCIHCVIITCSAHSPLSIAAKWRMSVLMCRLKDFVGCTEQ